jgi:hypothetical protein
MAVPQYDEDLIFGKRVWARKVIWLKEKVAVLALEVAD